MKKCSKCKKEKPYSEYYRDDRKLDGFYSCCKECHSRYQKLPKYKEHNRIWHKSHPVDISKKRGYKRRYRTTHKEEYNEYNRKYKKMRRMLIGNTVSQFPK